MTKENIDLKRINNEVETDPPLVDTSKKRSYTSLKAILSLLTIAQLTLATNQLIENSVIISLNADWFQHEESRLIYISLYSFADIRYK